MYAAAARGGATGPSVDALAPLAEGCRADLSSLDVRDPALRLPIVDALLDAAVFGRVAPGA
jgi:hypothetical protein